MSNEIQTATPQAVSEFFQTQTDADVPKVQAFIPYLNVAYGLSEIVTSRKAMPGDFVLGGQIVLGQKIQIVVADYRLHASIWNDIKKSTEGDCYHLSNDPRKIQEDPEWVNFNNQKISVGSKLQVGVDLLAWMVEQNTFAIFYMKNTLYSSFENIYKSSKGGRAIELVTRSQTSKKSGNLFFLIDSTPLNRAITGSVWNIPGISINCDISIPADLFQDAIVKFRKIENTETTTETVDRER